MPIETSEAKRFIYEVLAADAGLIAVVGTTNPRIYADQAPQGVTFPYVLYNVQGNSDVQGLGTVRVMNRPLFQIRGVGEGPPNTALKTVADRIDVVMQNIKARVAHSYVFTSRREQIIDRAEYDEANKRFHNLGGLYRLEVYPYVA